MALLSRIAAATLGGYAFAATGSIWISYVLPAARADAVATGLLVSFALYAAAILWAFAVRSATRAWIGILAPTLVFAGLAWLAGPHGAP